MSERRRQVLLWALTAVILGGSLAALWRTGFFEAAGTRQGLESYIDRCAPWSYLAFFAVQVASVVIAPIPSNLTAAAGAILFGLWPAFLLTWGAVLLGSVVVFALARVLGQDFVAGVVSRKISERYLEVIRRKRDVFLLLAFLLPFFPDDMLCILSGLTDIPFRRFALLVLLARPWGLLVACGVGSSAISIPMWAMAALGALGVAVFVLALKYGDRGEAFLLDKLKK